MSTENVIRGKLVIAQPFKTGIAYLVHVEPNDAKINGGQPVVIVSADEWQAKCDSCSHWANKTNEHLARAEAAEAKLARVENLRDDALKLADKSTGFAKEACLLVAEDITRALADSGAEKQEDKL